MENDVSVSAHGCQVGGLTDDAQGVLDNELDLLGEQAAALEVVAKRSGGCQYTQQGSTRPLRASAQP